MNKFELLKRLHFYKQSSPQLKTKIESAFIYSKVTQERLLFLGGDYCQYVAFVGSGKIRVLISGESGKEITLYYVHPGEGCLLNIASTLGEKPYPAMAIVEPSSELIFFAEEDFRNMMNQRELQSYVFDLFAQRYTGLVTLIEEIAFRKMDHRLAEFLYQSFNNKREPRRILRITHEQIASELGTAREVVSRLLKEFDRSNAIRQGRGKITLQNANLLRAFCPQH